MKIEISCRRCGGELSEDGTGKYKCKFCGGVFYGDHLQKEVEMLNSILDKAKQEKLATLRRLLWTELQKEYTDSIEIVSLCKSIKKIYDKDFYANLYEVLNGGSDKEICNFLDNIDAEEHYEDVPDVLAFMFKSLRSAHLLSVGSLIERAYGGNGSLYEKYMTEFAKEAEKAEREKKEKEIVFPTLQNYDRSQFDIEGTILKKYKGNQSEVILPQGVTSIWDLAFASCKSLASITIPDSVTSIGDEAFEGCESLMSIVIPDGVMSIGDSAFEGCESLMSIVIPDGVTSIGNYAFYGCESLMSIVIPDSVTSIGENAFRGCESFASIEVSPGNAIYYSAGNCLIEKQSKTLIAGCKNSIIPRDVTAIGENAFRGCKSLASITIPDSVTSIGEEAFEYCSSLTSVTIGNGVTSIGRGAFYYCYWLESVTIPDSVTSIGDYAFWHCSSLTSVTIPDSVTSIGNSAFYECSSLTSIVIPDSVTSIGGVAFWHCSSLTSVTIPDSVTSIGENAFYGCESLESITIPGSVTSIGKWAFSDCSSLASVIFKNPNGWSANGKNLASADLSDPSTAAKYLKEEYSNCSWNRK